MTVDQLYEQAKAIRPDVESVNHTEWAFDGERTSKYYAFISDAEDTVFSATSSQALLADLLASIKDSAGESDFTRSAIALNMIRASRSAEKAGA